MEETPNNAELPSSEPTAEELLGPPKTDLVSVGLSAL
jgi:hypothetical protein